MANLFLKWVDGERTAAQIGAILGLSPHETALYLVDLYREGLLEVRQGRVEMERLTAHHLGVLGVALQVLGP